MQVRGGKSKWVWRRTVVSIKHVELASEAGSFYYLLLFSPRSFVCFWYIVCTFWICKLFALYYYLILLIFAFFPLCIATAAQQFTSETLVYTWICQNQILGAIGNILYRFTAVWKCLPSLFCLSLNYVLFGLWTQTCDFLLCIRTPSVHEGCQLAISRH